MGQDPSGLGLVPACREGGDQMMSGLKVAGSSKNAEILADMKLAAGICTTSILEGLSCPTTTQEGEGRRQQQAKSEL
jgi:hypothetical protein